MKKTLVAIAALAAVSAFAQSSVSIDGVVNYGVKYAVTKAATTDGWKGDRNAINFKVVEDMGAGNKFGATLQMRYNPANAGASSTYVNSATGNLGDNLFEQSKFQFDTNYGQVAVGRFTNAQGVADLHPFEDAGQSTASHQAINGRHSGQIQLTTPSFMGAKLWALGAKATSNKYLGGGTGAGYVATSDLSNVAVGTGTKNVSTYANPDAAHRDLSAIGIDYNAGPLYVHVNSMTDLTNTKSTKIGATYDLGYAKFYANQYNQKDNIAYLAGSAATWKMTGVNTVVADAAAVTSGTGVGQAAHKATELAVKVPYGNYNFMYGRYSTNKDLTLGVTDGSTKAERSAYGVTYNITKRTQLMAMASNTKNGDATFMANGHNAFFGMQHNY
jgi:hypothetical protein